MELLHIANRVSQWEKRIKKTYIQIGYLILKSLHVMSTQINALLVTNCIAGVMVCVASAPFLTVMSYRTLTHLENHNANLQLTVKQIKIFNK
jgi:hypothetical protein